MQRQLVEIEEFMSRCFNNRMEAIKLHVQIE